MAVTSKVRGMLRTNGSVENQTLFEHAASTSVEAYWCLKWPVVTVVKPSVTFYREMFLGDIWGSTTTRGRLEENVKVLSTLHGQQVISDLFYSRQARPELEWALERAAAHMSQCADSGKDETTNQSWRVVAVPFKLRSDKEKHGWKDLRPSTSSLAWLAWLGLSETELEPSEPVCFTLLFQ